MGFTVKESMKGVAVLEKDGKKYTAAASGLKSRILKNTNTARLKGSCGFVVSGNGVSEWRIEGFADIGGELFFFGPFLDGSSLAALFPGAGCPQALAASLVTASENGWRPGMLSPDSILVSTDGSLLFFPAELMDFINTNRTEESAIEYLYPFNLVREGDSAPDFNSRAAFFMAALVYQQLSGHHAFADGDRDSIRRLILRRNYKSVFSIEPAVKKEAADLVDLSFSGAASIKSWADFSGRAGGDSGGIQLLDRSVGSDEAALIKKDADAAEKKRVRQNRRSVFWRKRKTVVFASALAVIAACILIFPSVKRALEPPVTAGMEAEEVIELYYDCFNTLDSEAMKDCVTGKAGKKDLDQIATIIVITRTRSAYERDGVFMNAKDWIASGGGPVESGMLVWGVTDLQIQPNEDGFYQVSYNRWSIPQPDEVPVAGNGTAAAVMPEASGVKDRIHLVRTKHAWAIDQLERSAGQ